MSNDIDFTAEEIEDIANECFMVVDEVNDEDYSDTLNQDDKWNKSFSDDRESVSSRLDNETMECNSDLEESNLAVEQNELNVVDEEEDEIKEEEEKSSDCHPYLDIAETFKVTKEQMMISDNVTVKSLSQTPLHEINTMPQFLKLIQELKQSKEISLYTQQSKDAYKVVLCYMVISTSEADYIIDAIKLQDGLLLLSEVFINPLIVKIVYGAYSIMKFLQQYLHLYLINVFDVQKAATIIGNGKKPRSFNVLLKRSYSVQKDSRCVNADFKQRPLPDRLKTFIRITPHFLIPFYHDYKRELLKNNKSGYQDILNECRDFCKMKFPNPETEIFEKVKQDLQNVQNCQNDILEQIYNWRNSVAEKENKNASLILPLATITRLAVEMPKNLPELYSLSDSIHLRNDATSIIKIIQNAKAKYKVSWGKNKKKVSVNNFPKTQVLENSNKSLKRKMDKPLQTTTWKKPKTETQFSNKPPLFGKQNKNNSVSHPNTTSTKIQRVAPSAAFLKDKKKKKFTQFQSKQRLTGPEVKKDTRWSPAGLANTCKSFQEPKSNQNSTLSVSHGVNMTLLNAISQLGNISTPASLMQPININLLSSLITNSQPSIKTNPSAQNLNQKSRSKKPSSKTLNFTNIPSQNAFYSGINAVNGSLGAPPPLLSLSVEPPSSRFDLPSNNSGRFQSSTENNSYGRSDEQSKFVTTTDRRSEFSDQEESSGFFNSNRQDVNRYSDYGQTLNVIDQQIDTLERTVSGLQSRNNPDYNFSNNAARNWF